MARFLAGPGRTQNLDAARAVLEGMTRSSGPSGVRDRVEAAWLSGLAPGAFTDLLRDLIDDEGVTVARQAIRSARVVGGQELVARLIDALGRADLSDEAATSLAEYGPSVLADLEEKLHDESVPVEVRRELP